MSTIKDKVAESIHHLPEESTLEDTQYHLYVLEKISKGQQSIKDGIRKITDSLYALQLESPQLLSVKPAAVDEFEKGGVQLYRNAKSEGFAV